MIWFTLAKANLKKRLEIKYSQSSSQNYLYALTIDPI
jgi:hypothetical protein